MDYNYLGATAIVILLIYVYGLSDKKPVEIEFTQPPPINKISVITEDSDIKKINSNILELYLLNVKTHINDILHNLRIDENDPDAYSTKFEMEAALARATASLKLYIKHNDLTIDFTKKPFPGYSDVDANDPSLYGIDGLSVEMSEARQKLENPLRNDLSDFDMSSTTDGVANLSKEIDNLIKVIKTERSAGTLDIRPLVYALKTLYKHCDTNVCDIVPSDINIVVYSAIMSENIDMIVAGVQTQRPKTINTEKGYTSSRCDETTAPRSANREYFVSKPARKSLYTHYVDDSQLSEQYNKPAYSASRILLSKISNTYMNDKPINREKSSLM
jgi:hypothetical protein